MTQARGPHVAVPAASGYPVGDLVTEAHLRSCTTVLSGGKMARHPGGTLPRQPWEGAGMRRLVVVFVYFSLLRLFVGVSEPLPPPGSRSRTSRPIRRGQHFSIQPDGMFKWSRSSMTTRAAT
jgi:hypothetical protein